MRKQTQQHAKILNHSAGLGVPSPDEVRQRAGELALIAGRAEPNVQDWQQAKLELHGGSSFAVDNDDEMLTSASERDMIAGGVGHQSPKIGFDGEENVVEELIAEGMEEAVHEQMLEAQLSIEEEEEP